MNPATSSPAIGTAFKVWIQFIPQALVELPIKHVAPVDGPKRVERVVPISIRKTPARRPSGSPCLQVHPFRRV